MERCVMKTNEIIEQAKTWDAATWLRGHMAFLKGTFQTNHTKSVDKEEEGFKAVSKKQTPFVNHEKRAYNKERAGVGHRKAKWYNT